jgi:hypothetical protein
MKNLLISTAVAALIATGAAAADLPSKTKAPVPTAVPVAAAPASVDSLTVQYGQDFGNNFGAKVDDVYQVSYSHKLGNGFSVGGFAATTQADSSLLKQNIEAQAAYSAPAMYGVTLGGKVGVGERFVNTGNFPYYALYGSADYAVGNGITLNAVSYRFRSAVDNATYGYQSHQLGTGITYDINSTYSVSAKVARNYDSSFNATGDQVTGALTVKF